MEVAKHALLLALIEQLRHHGSWTGKTHVQKAAFLLDASKAMDVPFQFVLYKHGPYSFDIEGELEQMRSYAAISSFPMATGYGVGLEPAQNAKWVKDHAPLSPEQTQAIERVCTFVGTRNVIDLERLATAAWIRTRERMNDPQKVAARLHELKPHISVEDALQADEVASDFLCSQ